MHAMTWTLYLTSIPCLYEGSHATQSFYSKYRHAPHHIDSREWEVTPLQRSTMAYFFPRAPGLVFNKSPQLRNASSIWMRWFKRTYGWRQREEREKASDWERERERERDTWLYWNQQAMSNACEAEACLQYSLALLYSLDVKNCVIFMWNENWCLLWNLHPAAPWLSWWPRFFHVRNEENNSTRQQ